MDRQIEREDNRREIKIREAGMTSKDLASGFCTVEPDGGNWFRPTAACASRNGKTNTRLIRSLFNMRPIQSEIKKGKWGQFHSSLEEEVFQGA
jgi:hypothetical protein